MFTLDDLAARAESLDALTGPLKPRSLDGWTWPP